MFIELSDVKETRMTPPTPAPTPTPPTQPPFKRIVVFGDLSAR